MKKKMWKVVALVATGGLVLQLGGCGALIADLAIQQIPVVLIGLLVQGLQAATQ